MFKHLFAKSDRYFFVTLTGMHGPQLFASVASAIHWLANCRINDTAKAQWSR